MHDDLSLLLNSLNDAQRQAVAAPLGRQLVLAGAGSGKTRVLVHRIAWLHQVERASLHSILSVTFTNKAAAEMRQRIEQLLHVNPQGMWVGTFHGLAHRLLRAHWREAKLAENFQILDSDDQQRLVKRVIRELGLDEQRWPARQAQWWINAQKDEGLRPRNIQPGGDLFLATQLKIYEAYEEACARAGVIDFSELLLRALDLWRDHPGLLEHYQRRFRHVLVDEFQDTNAVQYAWLRLLAKGGESLMVVGDDDQSIYGWRGARIENLHQFSADFPDAETIRLEQNYRSTACILKAANALIANNQGRLGKELWTSGCEGEPISLYAAFNEHDEARYVVESIEKAIRDGMSRSEIAILYRSNAQSRVLEEALLREKIPYRIYGGQRFFERAEIKNAMAYLRLIQARDNDAALERVINVPARGIGEKTVECLRQLAREQGLSMWAALHQAVGTKAVSGRAASALNGFVELVDTLALKVEKLPLHSMAQLVIEESGLLAYHRDEKGEKAQARVENLEELVSAARAFDNYSEEDDDIQSPLAAFLDHASLEAGEQQAGDHEDSVQLMTLHSAAGVPGRHGRRPVPAQDEPGGIRPPGRGTPPGLRRHHPRHAAAGDHLRRNTPAVRQRDLQQGLALRPRDSASAGAGSAAEQHGDALVQRQEHERLAAVRRRRRAGNTVQPRPARAPFAVRRRHHPQLRRLRRPGTGAGEFRGRGQQMADAQLRET